MFHACAIRFNMTENFKKFLVLSELNKVRMCTCAPRARMGVMEWANGLSGIGAWPQRIKSSSQPVWAGLSPTLIGHPLIPFPSNEKKGKKSN